MMRMVMDDDDDEDNIAMLLVTNPIVRPLGFARVQLHVQAIRSRI